MTVVKCRECGRKIAPQASACPHCGIGNPDPGRHDPKVRLRRIRFWFIVVSVPIVLFHMWAGKAPWERQRSAPVTAESGREQGHVPAAAQIGVGKVLEDRSYDSYAECDSVAGVVAQQLSDKGVVVDLQKDAGTELTVYTGLYRGAVIRFSCSGSRYRSEIIGQ